MKEIFEEIEKNVIRPAFKAAGFKKKSLHFNRNFEGVQQVVTLQLSAGNSYDSLRFYIRSGILVNNLVQAGERIAKSEANGDIRIDIEDLTKSLNSRGLGININAETDISQLGTNLNNGLREDLIPLLDTLTTEEACIQYLLVQDSVAKTREIIDYLCRANRDQDLELFVKRRLAFIDRIKDGYSDPNVAVRMVTAIRTQLESGNKLSDDLRVFMER